jgi:CubicO group peptidase (beta-lactamase class C family)
VGCVMEGASGQKYVEFVRENVLRPAQMSETQADNRYLVIPIELASITRRSPGRL